jgi:hypothetical protein
MLAYAGQREIAVYFDGRTNSVLKRLFQAGEGAFGEPTAGGYGPNPRFISNKG